MMPDMYQPIFDNSSKMETSIADLIVELMRDAYANDVLLDDIINGVASSLVHLVGDRMAPTTFLRLLAMRLEAGPLARRIGEIAH